MTAEFSDAVLRRGSVFVLLVNVLGMYKRFRSANELGGDKGRRSKIVFVLLASEDEKRGAYYHGEEIFPELEDLGSLHKNLKVGKMILGHSQYRER
jgi:hypothetical protein